MSGALWTWDELVPAAVGTADGAPRVPLTGFSIDTRSLQPGEVFVALRDRARRPRLRPRSFPQGRRRRRSSPRNTSASKAMARCCACAKPWRACAASPPLPAAATEARIVAVTGSVGKTGTKEALRNCLSRLGPTHAAEKSFNNHWGVPLTLARMPAEVSYGVFEIGMNHAGEITPLTALVRPHVAIVTTVEPVHLEFFGTTEKIAEAKAEIFSGIEPGGVAVLNRDNAHYDLLQRRASEHGARIVSFGRHENADVRPEVWSLDADGSDIAVHIGGAAHCLPRRRTGGAPCAELARRHRRPRRPRRRCREGCPGAGRRCALQRAAASGARSPCRAAPYPAHRRKLQRQSRLHALGAGGHGARSRGRAIAAVSRCSGDMLELGEDSGALHAALNDPVDAAEVDLVFACGRDMQRLFEALPAQRRGAWAPQSAGIAEALAQSVRAGDVVMVKGSLGSRMAPLVDALIAKSEQQHAQAPG